MAYIGRQQDGFGVRSRFIYTATGGQTTFNTDDSGNALSYADGAYVDVYLNGVLLDPADYTDTSLTSIVLDSGATASDILEVIVYDVFSVFSGTFTNGITASDSTFTGNILLKEEGNEVQFNTSSSPVNKIYSDDTYTTNGLTISADNGVALKSANNHLLLDDTGTNEMVFNVDSGERMRITSSGVGIGTTSPAEMLHVYHATANVNAIIESGDANAYLAFKDNSTSSNAHVFLGASGDNMTFFSGGASERMRLDSSGQLGIGVTSPSVKLDIDNGSLKVNRGNSSGDIAVFRGLNAEKVKIDTDGIKFNGDTAAANALDDYEEGTWTPGITGMTFSSTGGAYTKIGRRVQCSGFIIDCTSGTASAVGAFLSGLPFTVSNTLSTTSLEDGGVMHYYNNFGRSTSCITIAPDDSSTQCFLYFTQGASTGLTSVLRTDVDNSSFSCRFFFTYIST